jgi:hypothetical protein
MREREKERERERERERKRRRELGKKQVNISTELVGVS